MCIMSLKLRFACGLQGSRIADKEAVLVTLCSRSFRGGKTIVFFRTKQRAHRAKILFGLAGLPPAAELHGNMSQTARLESLDQFRKVCLSTDIYYVLSCAVLYNTP